MDIRFIKLADVLVAYSCDIQPGENVLIEATDTPPEFITVLIQRIYEAKANPYVILHDARVHRVWKRGLNPSQLALQKDVDLHRMENMQAYIGIRGGQNAFEGADVPSEIMSMFNREYVKPINSYRVPHTKRVVLRWPTPGFAQAAGMSTESFEDFYFDVCTMDYAAMAAAMEPLRELMNRTDKVHIKGPGTDLNFSIKGIPAIPCAGGMNIPDGEIYTAPVKNSINGKITFNTPQLFEGVLFRDIVLEFKKGRIIKATASDAERLNKILDADEGARYIGEFALGLHPKITKPMNDTLFDEKIAGSIHLTPGQAYEEADNGNQSSVHWDMVLLQDIAHGGGEIWFDGIMVRKDGVFVLPGLQALN